LVLKINDLFVYPVLSYLLKAKINNKKTPSNRYFLYTYWHMLSYCM